MAERSSSVPALTVDGLHVHYGASHALQGVDLKLPSGVLSVVGRNGMGKTTLCKAIMGLVPVTSGSISFRGQSLVGKSPTDIARMGIGYVPQGRRLWRSLTVDEHLKLVATAGGAWSVERIYSTFPRLAERRGNGGGQLSGGEQQMLAIGRALLLNPKLLVMDEPTEGLAPVIVSQVEDMLVRLGEAGDIDVLVIEQNIGVACGVADTVAIMVNGRINRSAPAAALAADRELQQRLLGVGRHSEDENTSPQEPDAAPGAATAMPTSVRIWQSNPKPPTRWSRPVPLHEHEALARISAVGAVSLTATPISVPGMATLDRDVVLVAGTLDTKGEEMRLLRDVLLASGLPARIVDLSTSGHQSSAEVPAHVIAAFHPQGAAGVFTGSRETAIEGMKLAFSRWLERQQGIAGVAAIGGAQGTAIILSALARLPIGVPKLVVTTVEGVTPVSDVTFMPAVADVQGLNSLTRAIIKNAGHAVAGMVGAKRAAGVIGSPLPRLILSTSSSVEAATGVLRGRLGEGWDFQAFQMSGAGEVAMERLIADGEPRAVIDLAMDGVADLLFAGMAPAPATRLEGVIRRRLPFIAAPGGLSTVRFPSADAVPARLRARQSMVVRGIVHVTLDADDLTRAGRWLAERINRMDGAVRLFLPEGGLSSIDCNDPSPRRALFSVLENNMRTTRERQLVRLPHHIDEPAFADSVVAAFNALHGNRTSRPLASRQARA